MISVGVEGDWSVDGEWGHWPGVAEVAAGNDGQVAVAGEVVFQ